MEAKILTEQNFKQEVVNYEGVALVDFWTSWCGPCKIMSPVIEELANDSVLTESGVKICKVNLDENQKLASEYSIMAVPTLVIFKGGKPTDRITGVESKQSISKKLNSVLNELA